MQAGACIAYVNMTHVNFFRGPECSLSCRTFNRVTYFVTTEGALYHLKPVPNGPIGICVMATYVRNRYQRLAAMIAA